MKQNYRPFMAELQRTKRNGGPAPAGADVEDHAPLPVPVAVVDNGDVLKAIAEVGAKLDRFLALDQIEIEKIQLEIGDISGRIKATKAEMAALRHPLAGEDRFQQASEELGAVVAATESATNTIMACTEELEEIVQELRAQMPEGYQASRINDMNDAIIRIFEACNFQDLTGQRITKVVRALSFIEERVEAMMGLWNKREFETMPLPPSITKRDGDLELHGPTEEAERGYVSQSDIDALFG